MFDITSEKSFYSVSEWLKDVSINSHYQTILVLVGNKIDKKDKYGHYLGGGLAEKMQKTLQK